MDFPTIYKRDSTGKIREWRMEVDGARYRTIAGLRGGAQVTSEWTVVARAKSRPTIEEQASFEANAAYEHKLSREYFSTIEEIDQPRFFKPMLAHKYEKVEFPVYSQPKLDGIRCLAQRSGLFSREGKPIVSCPHIEDALEPFFVNHPSAVLDGELYNHEHKDDFNAIVSAVRKSEPCDPLVIQYHVYDYASHPGDFGERANALVYDVFPIGGPIVVVNFGRVTGQAILDLLYEDYLAAGYEGQMVRLDRPYEQKRSKTLLKRKQFQDDEFPFIRWEEGLGNWAGVAKVAICQLADGREFGATVKGTKDFCASLLTTTPEDVTVRFFALTPDGVPRFPVAAAFHNGARL